MNDVPLPDQARVALVTGGARGMGREHALALSRAGWRVALIDLLAGQLRDVQAEIRDLGGQAKSYPGHITADGFAGEVADDVSSWGTIAGLVNNAGISSPPIPVDELSADGFRSMFEVHVLGSVRCIIAVLPHMRRAEFGRTAADPEQVRAEAIRGIPVGRYGQPGEVAAMARHLLTDEAGFVTGQVLQVDGGMVMA